MRFTIVTAAIFGLGYPLLVTGLAKIIFPRQAEGSLIVRNGQVIGFRAYRAKFHLRQVFPSAAVSRR
ncbi:MAG: potassium-transporting ATPase subunit C [Terracidiphilus sp.]